MHEKIGIGNLENHEEGKKWQTHCMALLQVWHSKHYGQDLQPIPDRVQGDCGLEAFSHSGFAYQCYAPEEKTDARRIYELQRDKLTRDLNKLNANKDALGAFLGLVKLNTYVLLVPDYPDKQILAHATKKAGEVLGWNLPFIRSDFKILVQDASAYQAESNAVYKVPETIVKTNRPQPEEVVSWISDHEDLSSVGLEKLSKINNASSQVEEALNSLIKAMIRGDNALEKLSLRFPEMHQRILEVVADKEDYLSVEYPRGAKDSPEKLTVIARDLQATILEEVPSLTTELSKQLAWRSVADWITRCPLDFGETG